MTQSTILSVAEMGYQSDRVGMRQTSYSFGMRDGGSRTEHTLQFEITGRQTLVLKSQRTDWIPNQRRNNLPAILEHPEVVVEFDKLDIDSLIKFLQDAKEFVREDLVYRKLKGEK